MGRALTWSANGVTLELHAPPAGRRVLRGMRGHGSPPVQINAEELPDGGEFVFGVRATAAEIMVPLVVEAETRPDVVAKVRELRKALWTTSRGGVGTLTAVEPDATMRRVEVWYAGGAEGAEGRDEAGNHWQRQGLLFRAPDPCWRDIDATVVEWANVAEPNFFPLLPVNLGSGQVLSSTSEVNSGDVDAFPVWKVTGPTTGFTLRNLTTNKELQYTAAVAAGTTVTIDTRPGVKTVVDNLSANKWSSMASASDLWSLVPGVNDLQVVVTSATSATLLRLEYLRRWLGA